MTLRLKVAVDDSAKQSTKDRLDGDRTEPMGSLHSFARTSAAETQQTSVEQQY